MNCTFYPACASVQTGLEYMDEVQEHVGQPPLNVGLIAGAGFCHDATWTLAKALSGTMRSTYTYTYRCIVKFMAVLSMHNWQLES